MQRTEKFFAASSRTPELVKCIPVMMLPILTLLSMALLPVPTLTNYSCMFVLCGIVYCSWWAPQYVPSTLLLLCGLVFDSFYTGIFGTYALLFLLLRISMIRLRKYQKFQHKTLPAMGIALPIMLLFFIVEWCVNTIQLGSAATNIDYLVRCGLTMISYPMIHKLLSGLIIQLQS